MTSPSIFSIKASTLHPLPFSAGIYELLDHQVQFHVRLPEASALYRLSLFAKELTPDVPASAPHDQVVEYRMPGMQAVRPFPPLLLSAYGPTEHAVDFDIRPLFDSSFLITAKGTWLQSAKNKCIRVNASHFVRRAELNIAYLAKRSGAIVLINRCHNSS